MNMNSRSGEQGYGVKVTGDRPAVDSPALSQITCLSGAESQTKEGEESNFAFGNKNTIKETDLDFVRLCKEGGHKGLLQIDEQSKTAEPVSYERKGGDWYYQEDKLGNETQQTNFRDTDSEFVRLSKQGGHEDLLKIQSGNENPFVNTHGRYIRKEDRILPASSLPAGMQPTSANIAPGNPIWLGGSGPEKGFIPGKRFMKKTSKESPFAVSEDWKKTQSRNPDKI